MGGLIFADKFSVATFFMVFFRFEFFSEFTGRHECARETGDVATIAGRIVMPRTGLRVGRLCPFLHTQVYRISTDTMGSYYD